MFVTRFGLDLEICSVCVNLLVEPAASKSGRTDSTKRERGVAPGAGEKDVPPTTCQPYVVNIEKMKPRLMPETSTVWARTRHGEDQPCRRGPKPSSRNVAVGSY